MRDFLEKNKLMWFACFFGIFLAGFLLVLLWANLNNENFGKAEKSSVENEKQTLPKNNTERLEGNKASLIFVGDLMTDRYIRSIVERKGFDYLLDDKLSELLNESDCAIANLEGPITDFNSRSQNSQEGSQDNFYFTMPSDTTGFLNNNNFCLVNLGNNHILNFGEEGLGQTKDKLKNSKIDFFGAQDQEGSNFAEKNLKGVKIAFVGYNQFSPSLKKEKTLDKIKKASRENDFTVVYAHWGEEYEEKSGINQRSLGRDFVDAGADLVIGSHPHVIQEMETYKGSRIYYSLGNFVFDQYFSEETKEGLMVEVIFDKKSENLKFEEIKVKINPSGKTELEN
ncbi:MAG: CapA family protein [Candidatus Moraniibacteriota bacterium]